MKGKYSDEGEIRGFFICLCHSGENESGQALPKVLSGQYDIDHIHCNTLLSWQVRYTNVT